MRRPERAATFPPELDPALRDRLTALCAEGWEFFERFETEVRDHRFHPFIASDYEVVLAALLEHRGSRLRFLEWGSASGVIAILADMLGYEAFGIELDESLVRTARELASRFDSGARFVEGSFLPAGYRFQSRGGQADTGSVAPTGWTGTVDAHAGPSGYVQLGRALDDFDVVYGYPWGGEEVMMLDLMQSYGRRDALLLLHGVDHGVTAYRGGLAVAGPARG